MSSRWHRSERNDMMFEGVPTQAWYRPTSDGHLRAYVAEDPSGWHVSLSYVDGDEKATRLPAIDELFHARRHLVPDDVTMAMIMPRSLEGSVPPMLHLHEITWPPKARA